MFFPINTSSLLCSLVCLKFLSFVEFVIVSKYLHMSMQWSIFLLLSDVGSTGGFSGLVWSKSECERCWCFLSKWREILLKKRTRVRSTIQSRFHICLHVEEENSKVSCFVWTYPIGMDAMERHYMLHYYIHFVPSISRGLCSFSFLFQFLPCATWAPHCRRLDLEKAGGLSCSDMIHIFGTLHAQQK